MCAKNRKISEEIIDAIEKHYRKGDLTNTQISEKYGVSFSSINRYMKQRGITKQKHTRSGKNPQRDLKVDAEYFDMLDTQKIRELAFIFRYGSIGKFGKGHKALSLYLLRSKMDDVFAVLEKFCNRSRDSVYLPEFEPNHCRIRVPNTILCDRLVDLGLKKEFPYFENEEWNWNFYDEYFKEGGSINNTSLRITFSSMKTDNLFKYLQEMGIEVEEIVIRRGGIVLYDENFIEKLMIRHPIFKEKMIEHCNEVEWTIKWSRVMIRLRNNV